MFSISVTALTGLTNQKRKRRGEGNLVKVMHQCHSGNTEIRVAAIDAGYNKSSEIAEVLCRSGLQTLILTHDDGDHINGAEYVLRNSPKPVDELWVPAYWMMQDAVLRRLANDSTAEDGESDLEEEKALEFSRIVASTEDQIFEWSAFDRLISVANLDNEIPFEGKEGSPVPEEWHGARDNLLGKLGDHLHGDIAVALQRIRASGINLYEQRKNERRVTPSWGSNNGEMARRTLQRVGAISAILYAAHERGTRIRSFLPATDAPYFKGDVCPRPAWKTAGEPEYLTIINAFEVVVGEPRISSRAALFMTLAAVTELSQQNRSALVSLVWPIHESGNGFLVWSDSSGEWLNKREFQVPWSRIGGMTAPHHGSANVAHRHIWDRLSESVGSTRIIVSGDLLETRGNRTRAASIRQVLEDSLANEYGVVHCLNPNTKDRFPRAEVEYASFGETCCCLGRHGIRQQAQTRINVSKFSACPAECLGCHS